MADEAGRPYAETTFRWIDPGHRYWLDRSLALHAPLLTAARLMAEPFYYTQGRLETWRDTGLLSGIDCRGLLAHPMLGDAIITPVHLPRGLVGALVWCSSEAIGVARVFAEQAEHMQALAAAAGKTDSEIIIYPDSQHGFHADYRAAYDAAAAKDGWARMLAHFAEHGVAAAHHAHP